MLLRRTRVQEVAAVARLLGRHQTVMLLALLCPGKKRGVEAAGSSSYYGTTATALKSRTRSSRPGDALTRRQQGRRTKEAAAIDAPLISFAARPAGGAPPAVVLKLMID